MIKNNGGILNNSSVQKNSVNLRITKKNNNKPTKKVILETSILDHISEKKSKKIVEKERPEPEAVGHLSDARKEEIIAEIVAKKKAKSKKTLKQPHINSSIPTSSIRENKKVTNNVNTLPIKEQPLSKAENKKRTLRLNINGNFGKENAEDVQAVNNLEVTNADIIDDEINIIDSADSSGNLSIVEDILEPVENKNIESSDETPAPKKEVSINQNSAFFYEPSIFEKFDIEVSNLDDETVEIEDTHDVESIENSQEQNDEEEQISTQNEIVEEKVDKTEVENEITEEEVDETEIEDEITTVDENKIEDDIPDEEDVLDNIIEATFSQEITEMPSDSSQESSNITEVDFTESVEENFKKEAADTIKPPVEKFFDSSIPNITSSNANNSFSKMKKIPYSESSVVFKKFSYEHAPIETAENNILDDSSSVFEPIQTNTTANVVKKALVNFEKNTSINNVPVSADTNNIVTPSIDETVASQVNNTFDLENGVPGDMGQINITTNLESFSDEQLDKELEEVLKTDEADEENDFSIETYFGVVEKTEEDNEDIEEFTEYDETEENKSDENAQMESFTKLIENLTESISTLSNRINYLDGNAQSAEPSIEDEIKDLDDLNVKDKNEISSLLKNVVTDEDELEESEKNEENIEPEKSIEPEEIIEINNEDNISDNTFDNNTVEETEEPSLLDFADNKNEDLNSIENILLESFNNHANINDDLKKELISEILSAEEEERSNKSQNDTSNNTVINKVTSTVQGSEATDDLFKIIDSLSQTITELEKEPEENIIESETTTENDGDLEIIDENIEPTNDDIKESDEILEITDENPLDEELEEALLTELAPVPQNTDDKAINILINKDDIFSIAILNETYEIVTDFDGISVISENLHISTPKNNFYVNIGEKYIEIHKQPDLFVVNTNFEDIEFANAINNVTFAKKKNIIELNIKEAFKITSINKKIELSMLNTSIANLTSVQEKDESKDEESSLCDNKTLLINEETQKVYLPYTLEEVMKKLNSSSEYQSLEDVIEQEYTLPLSTFKRPIISRFREAYKFMRSKENSSVYAALDLAIELMFNSNLNPAVIRASKDLKELNIYLDCLYENEIDKFDCFKILYKVLPKIK